MGKYTFILAAALAFSQSSADPFPGIYTGKDLRLELRAAGPAAYAGTIQVQGQSFPVNARNLNQQLTGAFTSGANRFPFQATLQNGRLRLVSDNNEFILTRETPATAHEHPKGFSIRPAVGWTAENNDDGVLLIPSGASGDEVYFAALQEGYNADDEAQSIQQLSQAFLQNGGQADRAGERRQLANGVSYYWEITDPKSGKRAGLKIYLIPSGTRANVIVAFGLPSRIETRDAGLQHMLAAIRSAAPKQVIASGPLADNTALSQQWLRKLQGKMIRQFHAYQGMSSDKRHYLNADGTYSFRGSGMVSVDVSGASGLSTGRNALQGRWRIREVDGGVFLQIQYNDGETGQYRLTQDARNWYMNGEKAFAVTPE